MTTSPIDRWIASHSEWRGHADLLIRVPFVREVLMEYPDAIGCDSMEGQFASDGSPRLAFYVRLRREGKDHRWAEMFASQRAPGAVTDDTFFAGIPRLAEQIGSDKQVDRYVKAARKHGYNPSPNDVYQPGLARFPGDPEAFVSRTKGRGYIKELCQRRGWGCSGSVNVQAAEPTSDPYSKANTIPMGKDLVAQYSRELIKQNPDLKTKSRAELRRMVLAKHGPT